MEYPRNNMYYDGTAFNRRTVPNMQVAANASSCGAGQEKNPCLDGMSLAMVYSPCQHFEKLYEPAEALRCGTLFCKLYMPFTGNRR